MYARCCMDSNKLDGLSTNTYAANYLILATKKAQQMNVSISELTDPTWTLSGDNPFLRFEVQRLI